jgi:hypothetical protein
MRPLFVFEDIHSPMRKDLFTVAGVRIQATRSAFLAVPIWTGFGFLIASLGGIGHSYFGIVLTGLLYAVLLYLANVIHSVGHIVAGKIVRAPMDALLLTATRDVTLYLNDRAACPLRVRIGRSLGGPISNLAAGLAALGFNALFRTGWLEFFAIVNVAVGLWTLCPVPTMDGWVIWRGLLGHGQSD